MRRRSSRAQFVFSQCRSLPRSLSAVLVLLLITADSHAANRRWNGQGGNTLFGTSGNWVGGVVPAALDVAQFGISNNFFLFQYTVSFNNNATNQALHIEDDLVTFDLNARTYFVTTASGIVIGNQAGGRPGQLTLLDGTISNSTNIDVGAAANTTGTLIVGAGGLISGAPTLNIGKLGTGTLTVQSDGDISSTGSTTIGVGNGITGTATIIGSGTAGSATLVTGTLNVGSTGNGTVNVQLGGLLQNSGAAGIGTGSLFTGVGTGIVNVMNAGSNWNSLGLLEIGDGGSGEVNITLGGTVNGVDSVIGANVNGGGEVNVNGVGSLWDNSGTVTIGGLGAGTLSVTNQGVVENTSGSIGAAGFSTSTGTVNVDGAGARWTNTDDLAVGAVGTGTLNITAGGTVQDADGYVGRDSSGTGTVTVVGPGSLWENSGGLLVGYAGEGTLSITGGGKVLNVNGTGTVGYVSGGTGTVAVDGDGSLWSSKFLTVGYGGTGTLSISGGGSVQCTVGTVGALSGFVGGPGLVIVDGDGSLWESSGPLVIGDAGFGELRIAAGGHVLSSTGVGGDDDLIGSQDDSIGLVTVDGDGSLWESSGSIIVGNDGAGVLEITAGGIVRSSLAAVVGAAAGGSGRVTVDGDGSLWDNSGDLRVGKEGVRATVEITGGGVVQNDSGTINGPDDSPSTVIVDGFGSTWVNSGSLTVGFAGAASLAITESGLVYTNTDAMISLRDDATGTVTVADAGSRWEIGGRLGVGYDVVAVSNAGVGTLRIQAGGTVNVTDETVVSAGDLLSLEGGTLSTSEIKFLKGGSANANFEWTSGTLHVFIFHGDIIVPNGGILAPGHSAGATTIVGDFAQDTGATLEIEIGGNSAGSEHDVVNITGFAALNGNLQLALLDGFVPNVAATFNILGAGAGIVGAFSNAANGQRLITSDGLGSFIVSYGAGSTFNPNQIVLSNFLPGVVPGDYNQNGTVDAADYTLWRDHFGQTFTLDNENADAMTPGLVDAEDYAFWKSHFGESLGSGSGATANAAVPEPATLVLLMLAAIGWYVRRSRAA